MIKRRDGSRVFFSLALSLWAIGSGGTAWAWGPTGHAVVAMIAQDRLSPSTLAKIQAIIGPGIGLDKIASCADVIRNDPNPMTCGGDGGFSLQPNKESAPWHFIDIEYSNPRPIEDYCNGGDCVVDQIQKDAGVLKDPNASQQEKQIALMFLVHFMGDIHQPLHCANDNDKGGNDKAVEFIPTNGPLVESDAKQKMNLHRLWDDLIMLPSVVAGQDPRSLANDLEKDMANRNVNSWVSKDMASNVPNIASESYGIAHDTIYSDFYHRQGGQPLSGKPGAPAVVLGQDYVDQMQRIAYGRLEMAGVRLAGILEQALNP